MTSTKSHNLPELFFPDDNRWASRAAARGEIRRLARGLYTPNLEEPAEQLVRRRWHDAAALYFPQAVIVDRSAALAGPAAEGSLFLDVGPSPVNPRPITLPGLTLRPRNGPGPILRDTQFVGLHMSSPARTMLDNLRPSRARKGLSRTLRRDEIEERLDRLARIRGAQVLNELRDEARVVAPTLQAKEQFELLDRLIGALLGTRETRLLTPAARARGRGLGYDTDRLALFETLRGELATQIFAARSQPSDSERILAFFEAYFSNWIEGTVFEVGEAEEIIFEGRIPPQRPADAHDVQGTFAAIVDRRLRDSVPSSPDELEDYLRDAHRQVMAGRPEAGPGEYKERANRAGGTHFVAPQEVRGTLREGLQTLHALPVGLARAIFAMFLVTEVHPFTDGNGRVARLLMNTELSAQGLCRVLIPLCYRDEYIGALRALSANGNPTPLWRMLDRAQRWTSLMPWSDRGRVIDQMTTTNALATPEESISRNLHLLDPR